MKREYVQDDLLVLPPEITKNGREHVLPLGSFAKRFLPASSGYLFHSKSRKTAFKGWSKAKSALDDLSGVQNWRLHDSRRSFRTKLSLLKVVPHVAEMLLNYASARGQLETTYDRCAYLDEKREAIVRSEEHMKSVLHP